MQPCSRGNLRGTKTKLCGTHRPRRTRGSHPEAHLEATRKSPRTHSTNVQREPVHLPCAGVPSPVPSPACPAAPRTVAVVVAEVLAAVAGEVGVVALVGSPAAAVAAALLAVEDTWVAADTSGAGTCTGQTHTGAQGAQSHFQIRLHRLVLVPRLILVSPLIQICMLLRIPILLPACLQNMQSAQNR